MSGRVFLAGACLLLLLNTAPVALAQQSDEGRPVQGAPGPAQGVVPTHGRPNLTSVIPNPDRNEPEFDEPPPGLRVSAAEMARLKALGRTTLPTGGREIHLDSTPTPLAPNLRTNFNGLGQNGWSPYDAAIAVGPNDIVVMTNEQWIVYDRSGAVVRAVTGFGTWWGTPAGGPFDPKCFFDPVGGRFVMIAVSRNASTGKAYTHISVSQTGDPTGAWYNYQLDSTMDGTAQTSNWSDYPGLGCDDNSIYVTSNQYTFTNSFQYAKIRVLSKTQLYSGSPATFTDFKGMTNSDGSLAFGLQPARTLSSTTSEYFLNTNPYGGNSVTLWRVSNAPGNPSLTRQKTYTIGAFSDPPDAVQPGTTTRVVTNDARMTDFVWRSGIIHASFSETFSGLAAVRYLRLDTTNNAVVKDVTYTQPGVYYYYPAVTDDSAGNMYLVFSRSSATEYPSIYHTGMQPADSAIQPSALVKAGLGTGGGNRWGDYNAIANDPADSLAVVSYAGWANTSGKWGTWIAGASFATFSTPLPTLTAISPTRGYIGTTASVTLTGSGFVPGMSILVSGTLVSVTNVLVSSSTQATAAFSVALAATLGNCNVTVTTPGGTSGSVVWKVVGVPVISTISPTSGNPGSAVAVTLTGSQYDGGEVSISGTGITVSNFKILNLGTKITFSANIAANAAGGPRNVTVYNGAGTSNAVVFTVNGSPPPTITTTSLANGESSVGYSGTLTATGGSPPYTWGISSGALPGGLSLATATGAISGMPNGAGTFNFTATITDSLAHTSSANLSIVVLPSVTITTSALPAGQVGIAYSAAVTAGNGQTPYTWNISAGALPAGLSLNTATGAITGVPSVSSTSNCSVTVTDALGGTASKALSIAVNPAVSVATTSLPSGTVGFAYTANLAAAGGTSPYTWAIAAGGLPAGLNLNAGNGVINGVPSLAGSSSFTAKVTDALGQTATMALSIAIASAPPPTLASMTPTTGNQGTMTSVVLTGTNFGWPATINIGGTNVTASNIVVVNQTTITANFNIGATATTGDRTVSVTTPGGATGTLLFRVLGVPVISSINPISGTRGTTVSITLLGSQFNSSTVGITPAADCTISGMKILNLATKITFNLTISSAAVTGPRSIVVSNAAGSSNAVTFTVN